MGERFTKKASFEFRVKEWRGDGWGEWRTEGWMEVSIKRWNWFTKWKWKFVPEMKRGSVDRLSANDWKPTELCSKTCVIKRRQQRRLSIGSHFTHRCTIYALINEPDPTWPGLTRRVGYTQVTAPTANAASHCCYLHRPRAVKWRHLSCDFTVFCFSVYISVMFSCCLFYSFVFLYVFYRVLVFLLLCCLIWRNRDWFCFRKSCYSDAMMAVRIKMYVYASYCKGAKMNIARQVFSVVFTI